MIPLKNIDELTPDTIQNYRSKLRRMFLRLSTLPNHEAERVKQKIARLEVQLGVKAENISGPGRPRRPNIFDQSATTKSPPNTNK